MKPNAHPLLEPVPEGSRIPWYSEHGWFRFKSQPETRIEGSCNVGLECRMYDNAIMRGNASMRNHASMHDKAAMYDYASMHEYASMRDNAVMRDCSSMRNNAVMCGYASMSGSAVIRSGCLVKVAITATVLQWVANLIAPGIVAVGCKVHPISEWLAEPPSKNIPWERHTTPEKARVVRLVIAAIAAQEALGNTWRKEDPNVRV